MKTLKLHNMYIDGILRHKQTQRCKSEARTPCGSLVLKFSAARAAGAHAANFLLPFFLENHTACELRTCTIMFVYS